MEPKCLFLDRKAIIKPISEKIIGGEQDNTIASYYKIEIEGDSWEYIFHSSAINNNPNNLDDKDKLLCLQETIKCNREGLTPIWMDNTIHNENGNQIKYIYKVQKQLENAKNLFDKELVTRNIENIINKPIDHKEKGQKILELIVKKNNREINPIRYVEISEIDRYFLGIFTKTEFYQWVIYLNSEKFISTTQDFKRVAERLLELGNKNLDEIDSKLRSKIEYAKNGKPNLMQLTIKGLNEISVINKNKPSKKVFIAMAFTDENKNEIKDHRKREVIKRVLESDNWESKLVDEEEDNDGIIDQIISLINESRFVIAELTHQKTGVYYEAGYAKGRGLPVIHIVKKGEQENCHFDVKHLNLIVWKNLDDLEIKLKNRIKATIKNS